MSELADLLERFRRGAELVAVATTGAAGPVLDFQPAPGKWGVRTIVCHLADTETVLAMRLRQIIAEDNPLMPVIDQDAWAERLDYSKRKLSPALEGFRRTRAENYELLKDLPEDVFARTGQHTKRGPITLLELLRIFAEHAEKHVQQIQAARAAYKEFKAAQPVPTT
ncbi:MAG TPA: DinB family protein [Bryobacteraceae bacterium]|nr:DinB family protein [Bryobacteraceae bacterium]